MTRLDRGYTRIRANETNAFPFARSPLPVDTAWRIVLLAMRTPDATRRRRFTAIVCAFFIA